MNFEDGRLSSARNSVPRVSNSQRWRIFSLQPTWPSVQKVLPIANQYAHRLNKRTPCPRSFHKRRKSGDEPSLPSGPGDQPPWFTRRPLQWPLTEPTPQTEPPESTPKGNGHWDGHRNAHPCPECKSSGMEPPVTPAFNSFFPIFPQNASERNGCHWQDVAVDADTSAAGAPHALLMKFPPYFCMPRPNTVTPQIPRSSLSLPQILISFSPYRNEDGLKTKRISFFTTRGRQRSGTETGVWGAGRCGCCGVLAPCSTRGLAF